VVALDLGRHARGTARLDHVRVDRALDEEVNLAQLGRFLLEDANELGGRSGAASPRLLDALEASQEALLRLHVHEWNLEVIAKGLDHLLGLATPHEAVIDEDAGELLTDRLVDQQRRDRESTPPERAQITFSDPTCSRIRAICSSITLAGVQAGAIPTTSCRKRSRIFWPFVVCTTSGWNWTA